MREPRLIDTRQLSPDEIEETGRLRPVTEAGVVSLMASIAELGMVKDEILVRQVKHPGGKLVLIAGGHRVEACRRLGMAVPAKIYDCTDDWARLAEIDDNLAGAEMNALDQAIFLARRKALYEKLHPETAAGAFKGNRHTGSLAADMMSVTSFARAAAEKFGLTDRHVRRMVAAGDRLDPRDIQLLRSAPKAVTLKVLQDIAKIGEATERYFVCETLAAGGAKSAGDARRRYAEKQGRAKPRATGEDAAWLALEGAWRRASKAVRRRFAEEHGAEIAALSGGAE